MEIYCEIDNTYSDDEEVDELVEKALESEDKFEVITKFIYSVYTEDTYEDSKEIQTTINDISDEVLAVLDDFYDCSNNTLKDRRGNYVELLVYSGLYSECNMLKERECIPYINNNKVEVYYNGENLNKNFDVGFWKDTDEWLELYECKANLRCFIERACNEAKKKEKLIYMNEIQKELDETITNVSVYLGDISIVDDIEEQHPPFPKVLNRKFNEVLEESISNIFDFINNYEEDVYIDFFNRNFLKKQIF